MFEVYMCKDACHGGRVEHTQKSWLDRGGLSMAEGDGRGEHQFMSGRENIILIYHAIEKDRWSPSERSGFRGERSICSGSS